ncbi:MAG: glycosyltransferase family 39 protein [Bacteroidales bacterium]|nr:glycosyltransferase family 39 protein [Bacteroidales bacterium]
MNRETKIKYVNITIAALALFNVMLHLVFSCNLEYHRDELLYFSLGLHPACGYATVPPLTGWIAWIMQNIFGYSLFAVRFFPALLSGLMVFLISALAKELGGSDYSRILAGIGIIISAFGLRTFLLFQPVHIDLILWTLSFYLITKYINTSSGKYLILFGITAGVALLNKYLIGLLFLSLIVIIPFTRYRIIFRNRKFWYGILAGTLIFLPNIIWQITNGLPVINHFAELKRTQLVNVDRAAFLLEQLVIPAAASILTIAGILFLFINKNARKYRFLGLVTISVIITLMLLHGKSYYTQGVFPFLIAAGAVSWESLLRKTWSRLILAVLIILITLPIVPIGVPVFKTELLIKYFNFMGANYGMDFVRRFEDNSIHSLPQDYADMLGWEELTALANKAWQMVPDKKSSFIYCENYGQAGAITIIGKKYGLPEAVSFHESFRYWIPTEFNPDITSFIYINDELGDDVNALFGKITKVGSISDPDAREYGTTVYLCENPVISFNKFWTERLKRLNNEN